MPTSPTTAVEPPLLCSKVMGNMSRVKLPRVVGKLVSLHKTHIFIRGELRLYTVCHFNSRIYSQLYYIHVLHVIGPYGNT